MTVENIKKGCTMHFRHSIGAGMVCDILAGDQGPSCRTVKQIPNVQLIYIRFIPEADVEIIVEDTTEDCPGTSIKRKALTKSVSPLPRYQKLLQEVCQCPPFCNWEGWFNPKQHWSICFHSTFIPLHGQALPSL